MKKLVVSLAKTAAVLTFFHFAGLTFFYLTNCINTENDLIAYGITAGMIVGAWLGLKEKFEMNKEP